MADKSAIQWLFDPWLGRQGATLSDWYGCTRISPACLNCYIFRTPPLRMNHLKFDKAAIGGKTEIMYAPDARIYDALRWSEPRMIFINSLSDLWHGQVPVRRIARVYAVMLLARRHIFLTLTKRHRRQANWLRNPKFAQYVREALTGIVDDIMTSDDPKIRSVHLRKDDVEAAFAHLNRLGPMVPLPNVWVGVTVENNAEAADRIDYLGKTPADVRWLSCEPLTDEFGDDALDLETHLRQPCPRCDGEGVVELVPGAGTDYCDNPQCDGGFVPFLVDWVVFGGESGPAAKATELDTEPAVGLRDIDLTRLEMLISQAKKVGAAVFVKQLGQPWAERVGASDRKGGNPDEWPENLRVREYPVQLEERAIGYALTKSGGGRRRTREAVDA